VAELEERERIAEQREKWRQQKKSQRNQQSRPQCPPDPPDKVDIPLSLVSKKEKKEEGRKKAHALSAQWVLTEADRNFAATRNWPQARIESEGERFRDYWLANGKAKADWAATWRNWVTSPYQSNGGQHGGQGRRHGSVLDAFDRLGERLKAAGATDDYIPGSSGPRPLELDTQVRSAGLKLVPKR
jgi:hypothetical protein